jgi:hypothetical protein
MESGARWTSFVIGVVLLALAGVSLLRDWIDGADFSLAVPAVLGVLGLGIGLSRAPLDPREARSHGPAGRADRDRIDE